MALAEWTITGNGSYSVIVDGTSPGTNTSVVDIVEDQAFQNNTLSTGANRSIESFISDSSPHNTDYGLMLRCSTTNPTFTGNNYALAISGTGGTLSVVIKKNYSGGTILASTSLSPLTGTISGWQKWRFSAYDSGGHAFVRAELWNGSAYVVILDVSDGSPLAAGHETIFSNGVTASHVRFDDPNIYNVT
jgi:hypothetical protein